MTKTSKNTSATIWTKFSQARPIPQSEIWIDTGSEVVRGFVCHDDHSRFQLVGESDRHPLGPAYKWTSNDPYVGEVYEKPAGVCGNPHHHDYVKFDLKDCDRSPAMGELVDKFFGHSHVTEEPKKDLPQGCLCAPSPYIYQDGPEFCDDTDAEGFPGGDERMGQSRYGHAPDMLSENPKDTIGSKKLPFSTLPWAVLGEAAAGMGEGAIKYGKHNYEVVGIRNSIYFDATLRHLIAWFLGEDIDPESGIHHVTKAITSLMVLRDAQLYDNVTDDRPVAPPADHLQAAKDLFVALTKDLKDCGKHYDRASIARRQSDEGRNNEL